METTSKEARQWAAIAHASALVGWLGNGIGFLVAPLVVWLIKRNDDPFVDEQGKEAVNFQITMLLAALVGLVLTVVLIGFLILLGVAICATVLPIIAAIKASEGQPYRYPFSLRLIK
jgi:uncharacterized protein